ncbi:hypothetical protein [Niallia sp. FSL W8-0635]|uniref:hypothetical protein n=1 Tax=Niallia sp. FSL W8-0635 TaxID=2975337 RepID=UPI0009CFDF64|nr:Uncharacterised protein [Mycobacteroides abscessus subsp. abscessus]HEO8422399.1 hypothetical protein [Yersinia enterocolitica]
MKWSEFVSHGKNRVLPVIIEVYGKKYPHYASKLYPICYTSFSDLGILFTPCGLFRKKKKKSIRTVRYKEIISVEFNVQRVPTVFLYLLGSSLHLNIIIHLKDHSSLHLESEDISLFPDLVQLLKKHKVGIKDPLKLQKILKEQNTMEKFYSYIDKYLETDAHSNDKEPKIK